MLCPNTVISSQSKSFGRWCRRMPGQCLESAWRRTSRSIPSIIRPNACRQEGQVSKFRESRNLEWRHKAGGNDEDHSAAWKRTVRLVTGGLGLHANNGKPMKCPRCCPCCKHWGGHRSIDPRWAMTIRTRNACFGHSHTSRPIPISHVWDGQATQPGALGRPDPKLDTHDWDLAESLERTADEEQAESHNHMITGHDNLLDKHR